MSSGEALDAALVATAREMYFRFVKLKEISRQTDISIFELRKLAYGDGKEDKEAWFNERRAGMADDFIEVGERNRFSAHEFAAYAIDFMKRSIADLSSVKKDKDGNVKPFRGLSAHDMDKLAGALVKVDKLLRLTSGLPTDIVGYNAAPEQSVLSSGPIHQVIDIEKVISAISKDKSMQRHLMALKELNNEQSESPTNESIELDSRVATVDARSDGSSGHEASGSLTAQSFRDIRGERVGDSGLNESPRPDGDSRRVNSSGVETLPPVEHPSAERSVERDAAQSVEKFRRGSFEEIGESRARSDRSEERSSGTAYGFDEEYE